MRDISRKSEADDSISYSIAKIRTEVYRFDTAKEAVAYFEKRPYQNQNDIERYGRLLAYLKDGRTTKALDIVDYLIDATPRSSPITLRSAKRRSCLVVKTKH